MKPLRCIAAMDAKRGIGKNNSLPWRLKLVLIYFSQAICSKVHSMHLGPKISGVELTFPSAWILPKL